VKKDKFIVDMKYYYIGTNRKRESQNKKKRNKKQKDIF